MGSVLSEALCSLVAAHWEATIEDRRPELERDRLIPTGVGKVTDWVRSIDHVDDKLSQSKLLCPECLNVFQQQTLPPQVDSIPKGNPR